METWLTEWSFEHMCTFLCWSRLQLSAGVVFLAPAAGGQVLDGWWWLWFMLAFLLLMVLVRCLCVVTGKLRSKATLRSEEALDSNGRLKKTRNWKRLKYGSLSCRALSSSPFS